MKLFVKGLIGKCGFDLHRLSPTSNPAYQLLQGLRKFHVDLLLDIGANTGQFVQEMRIVGYSGRVVSFEPLSDAFVQLQQNASSDEKWTVHDRGAIGDVDGVIEINISGNSQSSSILPMLAAHRSAAVDSAYIASETTPIRTLDSVSPSYLDEATNLFIKIDTQGFEWQVLDGGLETLKQARGLLVELSLLPLYDGQRLWRHIIDRLESEGFTLWALQKGFTDPRDGRTLQMDAIFFRLGEHEARPK